MSKLVSTRDPERQPISYSDALLEGLAPDGGLYVPNEYPQLSHEDLTNLSGQHYTEIFTFVKSLFTDDIPRGVIARIAEESFSTDNFPATVSGNVVPVTEIADNFYIQELSLGPTAAFKDMALQPLAREMDYVLEKRGLHLDLLGATSGDTGSAAEAAFKSLGRLSLFMLSPEEGMSSFQKAQMGSLSGGNIFNISIDGRFDDCQDLVKEVKGLPEFNNLGAVNSINWGRIVSQIPYYVSGYLQAVEKIGDQVDFVVPTGNFGNIFAGYAARKMGLPIRRLVAATNENSVIADVINMGSYRQRPARVTSSPSMDISKASNFERLVFDLFEGDAEKTKSYMEEFEKKSIVQFEDHGLKRQVLTNDYGFDSGSSNHFLRLEAIRWAYKKSGRLIDPHTADAVATYLDSEEPDIPTVCLSTALPVKFEATIKEALGFIPKREERFEKLSDQTGGFTQMDKNGSHLQSFIRKNRLAK